MGQRPNLHVKLPYIIYMYRVLPTVVCTAVVRLVVHPTYMQLQHDSDMQHDSG